MVCLPTQVAVKIVGPSAIGEDGLTNVPFPSFGNIFFILRKVGKAQSPFLSCCFTCKTVDNKI